MELDLSSLGDLLFPIFLIRTRFNLFLKNLLSNVKYNKDINHYNSNSTTPGYWGIAISEAEKVENIGNNINLWRLAKSGIIKSIKIELDLILF